MSIHIPTGLINGKGSSGVKVSVPWDDNNRAKGDKRREGEGRGRRGKGRGRKGMRKRGERERKEKEERAKVKEREGWGLGYLPQCTRPHAKQIHGLFLDLQTKHKITASISTYTQCFYSNIKALCGQTLKQCG